MRIQSLLPPIHINLRGLLIGGLGREQVLERDKIVILHLEGRRLEEGGHVVFVMQQAALQTGVCFLCTEVGGL